MTRIIGGVAGGRRLQTSPGSRTRPTSDRVREALFSRLAHMDVLQGARVLDLYAGSGALGLEAASRGAAEVTLVESDRAAAQAARANATSLGLEGIHVRAERVERVLVAGPSGSAGEAAAAGMDLVMLDPPYDVPEQTLADVLALLVVHRWLSPEAVVVVERSSRSPGPRWPVGIEAAGERRYGGTKMWFAVFPGPERVA